VSALEDHVAKLDKALLHGQQDDIGSETNKKTAKSGKDTTKYLFNGQTYGKNRLVLAVVQKYAEENPNISADDLMYAFDNSLQGTDRTDKLHFRVSGGIRQSRITVLLSSRARAGRAGRRFRRTFFDARR
jgi:hypothetical protein